jgi:hypothetical protein
MNTKLTWVLQWARRLRDFLVAHEPKSDVAELEALRKDLDDAITQLTAGAAAQEAITKQSRVQTTEIKRLRSVLRDGNIKPIVRMSRTMKLEINGTEITFVLPDPNVTSERLAAAGDAMVTALNVLGPQFVAKGFASNFVEQLTNAVKALRDAIDQRSAQVAKRTGTTAAMQQEGDRAVQLVRVIDTLVRPVIKTDPDLLAAWDNLLILPRPQKSAGGVVAKPVASTPTPTATAATATATTTAVGASPSTPISAPATATAAAA